MFLVDQADNCFRLRAQAHSEGGVQYDPSLVLKFDEGVLGEVYKAGKATNLGNVRHHPRFVKANPKTRSELCIPIELDGSIRWLLNVEDSVENAFAEEERIVLEDIVKEAHYVFEHLYAHYFLEAFFAGSYEALFVADKAGRIVRCNEAAATLLGYTDCEQIADKNISDIVTQEDSGLDFITKEVNDHYRLIKADGKQVDVFLSGSELHKDFDRKVFCAKDLSQIQRLEELEAIEEMYHEIAMQTRTPFSLLFAWLRRLYDEDVDTPASDVIDKAIRQLRRIELTYERLVLHDVRKEHGEFNPVLFDIQSLVKMALDEFPRSESTRVMRDIPESLPQLQGDLFQLTFVLQTILSYLLRFASVDECIRVVARPEEGRVRIVITGFNPVAKTVEAEMDNDVLLKARARMDVALGETVIRRFIVGNHNGTYERVPVGKDKVDFRLTLPISEKE